MGEELELSRTREDEWNLPGKRGEGLLSKRGSRSERPEMGRHKMYSEDLAEARPLSLHFHMLTNPEVSEPHPFGEF